MINKSFLFLSLPAFLFLIQCNQPAKQNTGNDNQSNAFANVSQVVNGKPVSVMLTCYSTTLLANGTDHANMHIALVDSLNRAMAALPIPTFTCLSIAFTKAQACSAKTL